MDLSIDIGENRLNIRTAVLIIHNNKLLAHNEINASYYALLGGRIKLGEDSKTAILREIKEELGKEIIITDYVTTIENFFEEEGKKFHEIEFVYKAEFKDKENIDTTKSLKNLEGKSNLRYDWLDLDKIDEYDLRPEIIKTIIKTNNNDKHHFYF